MLERILNLLKIVRSNTLALIEKNINVLISHLPTTIPNAPNVRDFGLLQNSGGWSIPIGTTIVLDVGL